MSLSSSKGAHSIEDLCAFGLLAAPPSDGLINAVKNHAVSLTPSVLSLIRTGDPVDPIAQQFVPNEKENAPFPAARKDPIGDDQHSPVKGVIHRYPDRLLLNLSYACPVSCRFCFRRSKINGKASTLSEQEIETALAYIKAHPEIWEVILSGGEPLALSPRRLASVLKELDKIDHVRALRIHTRAPITVPEVFSTPLIHLLASPQKPLSLFIHCNHPQELGNETRSILSKLSQAGIPLYSQSVLLRGVNDKTETLTDLMRAFVECKIKPHYLHHPDLAEGTAHFHVSIDKGIELVQALRGNLSSLCQPTYVLDCPGGLGKVSLLSPCAKKTPEGWELTTYQGQKFLYKIFAE
ncbi:MAG: lysine-2,3-aminomutase-like protein [Bdellovibrionales bacterium]